MAALYDELRGTTSFDMPEKRERILGLFDDVDYEHDRVHLLLILDALVKATVRAMEADGHDVSDLRSAILADKRKLALKEAARGNDLAEPAELLRILEREITMGRMERDAYYHHARSAADVIGGPPQPTDEPVR